MILVLLLLRYDVDGFLQLVEDVFHEDDALESSPHAFEVFAAGRHQVVSLLARGDDGYLEAEVLQRLFAFVFDAVLRDEHFPQVEQIDRMQALFALRHQTVRQAVEEDARFDEAAAIEIDTRAGVGIESDSPNVFHSHPKVEAPWLAEVSDLGEEAVLSRCRLCLLL